MSVKTKTSDNIGIQETRDNNGIWWPGTMTKTKPEQPLSH